MARFHIYGSIAESNNDKGIKSSRAWESKFMEYGKMTGNQVDSQVMNSLIDGTKFINKEQKDSKIVSNLRIS